MPIAPLPDVKLNYLQFSQLNSNHSQNSPKPKPDLILVHGLATSLAFWYHLAECFAHTHRVTLFDLRGHGRSSMPASGYTPSHLAADLRALMEYLEIETADLVGHSFGGAVSLHFALNYPQKVNRLVLADTRLKLFQPQLQTRDWLHWSQLKPNLAKFDIEISEDHPEAGYQLLVEIARLQLQQPQKKSPFPKILAKLFPQGSKQSAQRWLKLLDTTTAAQDFQTGNTLNFNQVKNFSQPTLAIYGEQSPTLPTARALQKIWSHLEFALVPQAGHFFPLSQPDFLVNAINVYFQSRTKSRITKISFPENL